MHIRKTIKAKIFNPTKRKHKLLSQEYDNYQLLMESLTDKSDCTEIYRQIDLYPATKRLALKFAQKYKPNPDKADKRHSLLIDRDIFKIEKRRTKITRYWAKIVVNGVPEGIWLPIKLANKHRKLLKLSVRRIRLTKRGEEFFLYITIQKQMVIQIPHNPRILGIDLGEKTLAASVELTGDSIINPGLYGRQARGTRRHFAWLRKKLGKKKKLKPIKKMADKEQRIIADLLHKISSRIVKSAGTDTVITLGDLKGIRNRANSKRLNRILSNMPYDKLTRYITYKALWQGNVVIKISEKWTSKTCHHCGKIGTRPSQGLFKCPYCGLQYNADLNAAINLANRCLDYISRHGVNSFPPGKRSELTLEQDCLG